MISREPYHDILRDMRDACEEAVERGELQKTSDGKYIAPDYWLSIAVWPRPAVELGNEDNSSTDKHATKEAAQAVCRLLRKNGLGGDGKIFPIATSVEPVFATKTIAEGGAL